MQNNVRVSGQGRRVYTTPAEGEVYPPLQPGDYFQLPNGDWYGKTPNGESCNLQHHKTVEHEDGTITVSPSIMISYVHPEKGRVELWHGWLERGYWRSC